MAETGHAKNIQHFEELIAACTGYGGVYNPSNGDLAVAKLQNKLDASNTAMDDVSAKNASQDLAETGRETLFAPLGKLVTRTVNYYASTGATDNRIADAKGFNRKIQGRRAKPAKKDDPSTPEDESKESISASQQSYTQKVEHFDGIIDLYSSDGMYNPNENDLKVTSLTDYSTQLKAANTGVINAITNTVNARISRNKAMYDGTTGLCAIAALVKKYVKGLFGASSPQYKQVSGLEFRKPRT